MSVNVGNLYQLRSPGDVRSLLGQEGITIRLRKAAFGSTIRMHMAFFDTPEILGWKTLEGWWSKISKR